MKVGKLVSLFCSFSLNETERVEVYSCEKLLTKLFAKSVPELGGFPLLSNFLPEKVD